MMRIRTPADLAKGAAALAASDPVMRDLLHNHAPLPMRLTDNDFPALFSIIVGQQVSTASASAIWSRLAGAGLTSERAVGRSAATALTGCGLSRPKAGYALAIARAGIDWAALDRLDDDGARAALVALPGVGPWTAEVFLLSALGRADALPAGDLALQEAARLAYGLDKRPQAQDFLDLAEPWRPWRAVAARALWAYYRQAKSREGIR